MAENLNSNSKYGISLSLARLKKCNKLATNYNLFYVHDVNWSQKSKLGVCLHFCGHMSGGKIQMSTLKKNIY